LWKRPRPKLGCGAKERKKDVLGNGYLEDLEEDGKMTLRWVLMK
jgi:hypothetical protein